MCVCGPLTTLQMLQNTGSKKSDGHAQFDISNSARMRLPLRKLESGAVQNDQVAAVSFNTCWIQTHSVSINLTTKPLKKHSFIFINTKIGVWIIKTHHLDLIPRILDILALSN